MSDSTTSNLNGAARHGDRDVAHLDALLDVLVRDHLALRLGVAAAEVERWPWAEVLSQRIGRDALALDLVAGLLLRGGDDADCWAEAAARLITYLGRATDYAELPAPQPMDADLLGLLLAYWHQELGLVGRQRLRALGAFARGASFADTAAAQVWECALPAARRQLTAFRKAGLLAQDGDRWLLPAPFCGTLRSLLQRAGDDAGGRHAAAYAAALRQAALEGQFDALRADYPQLRRAFDWSVEHELRRALDLIGDAVGLQAQLGQLLDGLRWSERALAAARALGPPAVVAEAQFLRGALLARVAELPGEDRRARLLDALKAYDAALDVYAPDNGPLACAAAHHNRALVLAGLARLADEDRRARLLAALESFNVALRLRSPEATPADYAASQSGRAALLSDLADLPGEDRRARLLEALGAYAAALRGDSPDLPPLERARTESNRALVLSALAQVPGEPARQHLLAALAACEGALALLDPALAPLDYAGIQNNRANLLRLLAQQPDEDQPARLLASLAAYDEALRFYSPSAEPAAYASVQQVRAGLLGVIAALPGQDRTRRLLEAIQSFDLALRAHSAERLPDAYIAIQDGRASLLTDLAEQPGENRWLRLRTALKAYDDALRVFVAERAPLAYALMQQRRGNLSILLAGFAWEDRRIRLQVAHNAYSEALRFYTPAAAPLARAITLGTLAGVCQTLAELPGMDRLAHLEQALGGAWEAYNLFVALEQPSLRERATGQLLRLRAACRLDFAELWARVADTAPPGWLDPAAQVAPQVGALLSAADGQQLLAAWRQVPPAFQTAVLDRIEQLAAQAEHAGDAARASDLRQRMAAVRQVEQIQREPSAAARWQAFEAALSHYREALGAAEARPDDIDGWYTAAEAGEALRSAEFTGLPGVNTAALHASLASLYARLAIALERAGDLHGAFAANGHAIELQPASAQWRRNRAAILIRLGWLAEAEQALATAQELEPDSPHQHDLELALREARA